MLHLGKIGLTISDWQPLVDELRKCYSIYQAYTSDGFTYPLVSILNEQSDDKGCDLLIVDTIRHKEDIETVYNLKHQFVNNKRKFQCITIFSLVRQSDLPYWITPIFSYSLN